MAAFMSNEGKERIIFAQLEALKEIRYYDNLFKYFVEVNTLFQIP